METFLTKNFQWLLGIWKIADGRPIYEEWQLRNERTLRGFRYTLRYGEKQAQEKFNLEQRDNDIYYLIIASETMERVALKMNFFAEQMAVFENPEKTFPTFIQYKLTPKNVLHVTSDGQRTDNKSQRVVYPFMKMS